MPTYSYACTECDNSFDAVQSFTDDALTTCPKCSGRLRKLFNSVGVVFKGSGFYRTDSRAPAASSSSSSSDSSSSDSPASSPSGSSAASGSATPAPAAPKSAPAPATATGSG